MSRAQRRCGLEEKGPLGNRREAAHRDDRAGTADIAPAQEKRDPRSCEAVGVCATNSPSRSVLLSEKNKASKHPRGDKPQSPQREGTKGQTKVNVVSAQSNSRVCRNVRAERGTLLKTCQPQV